MRMPSQKIQRLHQLPVPWLRRLCSSTSTASNDLLGKPADISEEAIDWHALTRDASSHAVSIIMYYRLRDLGLLDRLPVSVGGAWEADALHAKLQASLQRKDALNISRSLTAHGIRHAFFKGFVYRDWLYEPNWARLSGDADLLIKGFDVEKVRQVMLTLGFEQAASTIDYQHFKPATARLIQETEAQHYELAQFVKSYRLVDCPPWIFGPSFRRRAPFTFEKEGEEVLFHSVVDIHWALHFIFATEQPLSEIVNETNPIPRLVTSWNLFISFFKLYFEAFDRPYYGFHHLIDLAALLRTQPTKNDWEMIATLVRRYGLHAAAFYTLTAAEKLIGRPAVPKALLHEWSVTAPDRDAMPDGIEKRTYHSNLDLGDFMPYVIGRRVSSQLLGR